MAFKFLVSFVALLAVASAHPQGGQCGQKGGVWPGKGFLNRGNLLGGNLFEGLAGNLVPEIVNAGGSVSGGALSGGMISGYNTGLLGGEISLAPKPEIIEVFAAPHVSHSYQKPEIVEVFAAPHVSHSYQKPEIVEVFAAPHVSHSYQKPEIIEMFAAPQVSQPYYKPEIIEVFAAPQVSQPCHKKVQVPVTYMVNEQIDVPVEVVENIPVSEENAEYQKDEREYKAGAHAYEEGHSHYQRWEDAEAIDRDACERAQLRGSCSYIPTTRTEHQKVCVPVEVEEMVELDIEVPEVRVQPTCGCGRSHPQLMASAPQTYFIEDTPKYVYSQPASAPQKIFLEEKIVPHYSAHAPQTIVLEESGLGLGLGLKAGLGLNLPGLSGLAGLAKPCKQHGNLRCGCRL